MPLVAAMFRASLLALLATAVAACAPSRVQEVDDDSVSAAERSFSDRIADQRLRGRILADILNDDELLDESNIGVTVHNGVVLLTGEVPNANAGRRIARLARAQEGARRVHNELVVAELSSVMARGRDSLINRNARTRIRQLDSPDSLDPSRIRVVTERGRIYLMGRVTRDEAGAITETVRQVSGTREVVRLFDYLD